jgi:uncharacterized protein YjbI with pentapeptide repeats
MRRNKSLSSVAPAKQQGLQLAGSQEKDWSGRDFHRLSIRGQNFFEFIFNGCSFDGLRAAQSIFQHAEFTEAHFANCTFKDASFDHSDFVLTDIDASEFIRCSFQNAEWRDTLFENVHFRQCIFRNTTTSLTRFVGCDFDDASACNFVGPSKRFSIFSGTKFPLPLDQLSFLQTNFGISSESQTPALPPLPEDPLFELSLRRYARMMTSAHLYLLVLRALFDITSARGAPQRLRMKYLSEICKVCLDEQVLSVFGLQLLERALSRAASVIHDRDHALDLLSLLLSVRASLRGSIVSVEQQVANVPTVLTRDLRLRMEFEHSYQRTSIEDYLHQMAAYCHLPRERFIVESFQVGSTIADVLIMGSAYVADVFRFIGYSLSLATVTIKQAGKLRAEYSRLAKPASKQKKAAKVVARSSPVGKRRRSAPSIENMTNELVGVKLENAKPIEIFVDAMNERVLVVDGRVSVRITLTDH